jgi:type I restriction enzyme S subunit
MSVLRWQQAGVLLVEDGNHGENRPRPNEFGERGMAFIRAADMSDGQVLFETAQKINEVAQNRVRKGIGKPRDILISHKGTIGRVARVPDACPPFVCSPQTTFWRVLDRTRLDPAFLYILLRSPQFQSEFAVRSGETDMAGYVSLTSQRAFELSLPPLPEQQAIAAVLGALDDKIELNRRMNRTLEAMARALFRSWFVDFDPVHAKAEGRAPAHMDPATAARFPARFGENGLPEGWTISTVGAEFDLIMGQSPPGSTYNDDGVGLPFFQGRTDFGFRYPENRKHCSAPTRIAEAEDTLVSVRAPVGDINRAWEKCCIGRGVAAVRRRRGEASYTYYAIQSLQEQLAAFEHTGTVFGSINKGQFEALATVAPAQKFISAFQVFGGALDARLRVNTAESRTLAALRDALLPKLMSGELRVRDAERAVAEAV